MGDVGTGKTHMASALCALACERRLEARFFTASSLVMRLRRARDCFSQQLNLGFHD